MVNKTDVDGVIYLMDDIVSDNGVPRNIRKSVSDAKDKLQAGGTDVNFTSAIYLLDECLNDINMPFHTRSPQNTTSGSSTSTVRSESVCPRRGTTCR